MLRPGRGGSPPVDPSDHNLIGGDGCGCHVGEFEETRNVLDEDVSLPWEHTRHLRRGYVACQAMLMKPGDVTLTLEVDGSAIRSARSGDSHIVFVSYELP